MILTYMAKDFKTIISLQMHFIVFGTKQEQSGQRKDWVVWEKNSQKISSIIIDNNLMLDTHIEFFARKLMEN